MLVSIITPSYNSSQFVSETIESVINQTYINWELIIVDDCSTDNSIKIIKKFTSKDNRIKLLENKVNAGAAKSRNRAIKSAQGDFIAFLDSDDLWKPNKLELQLSFMKENDIKFLYSHYEWIDENGNFIKEMSRLPEKANYLDTIKHNKIGCLTVIFKKECFKDYEMPDIRKRQDFGLWLKLLRQCDYAYCLPKNLASYRIRSNSISSNKFKLVKYHWKLYRKIEKHSIIKTLYFIVYLILSKILKL